MINGLILIDFQIRVTISRKYLLTKGRIMKKRITVILALVLVALTLFSCGDKDNTSKTDAYPVLTVNELSGETATAEDSKLRITYLKDEWTYNEGFEPFMLYYTDHIGRSEGSTNINIQSMGPMLRSISQKDFEVMLASVEAENPGFMRIEVSELRSLKNRTVVYFEVITEITDDVIDMLIEQGTFTEEDINAIGGREVLLNSVPSTKQIMIAAVADKNLVLYTGSYYDEATKQLTIDSISYLIDNTEVK